MEKVIADTTYIVNTLYLSFTAEMSEYNVATQTLKIDQPDPDINLDDVQNIYNLYEDNLFIDNQPMPQLLRHQVGNTYNDRPVPIDNAYFEEDFYRPSGGSAEFGFPLALPAALSSRGVGQGQVAGEGVDSTNYEANSYLCITPLPDGNLTEQILNNYSYKDYHRKRNDDAPLSDYKSLDETFSWNHLKRDLGLVWTTERTDYTKEFGNVLIGRLTLNSNINVTGYYYYKQLKYPFSIVNGRIQRP
tara:strand:- start:50 stop:787 length:738 start_codon:yes stop_codon:yes gene_type:complete